MRHTQRSKDSGFTLVELVVVMVVMSIIVGFFGALLSINYRESIKARAVAKVNRDIYNALDAIEADVRSAIKFKASSNDGYDTFANDDYGKGNVYSPSTPYTWTYTSTGSDSNLILMQHATTAGKEAKSREVVRIRTPAYNCTNLKQLQPSYKRIIIYFVRNNSLYRRTLYNKLISFHGGVSVPSSMYFCLDADDSGRLIAYTNNTMPPDSNLLINTIYINMGAYTDTKLADNVISFHVNYYKDGSIVPHLYDIPNSTSSMLDEATNINVTIGIEPPKNKDASSTQTLNVYKVNN